MEISDKASVWGNDKCNNCGGCGGVRKYLFIRKYNTCRLSTLLSSSLIQYINYFVQFVNISVEVDVGDRQWSVARSIFIIILINILIADTFEFELESVCVCVFVCVCMCLQSISIDFRLNNASNTFVISIRPRCTCFN